MAKRQNDKVPSGPDQPATAPKPPRLTNADVARALREMSLFFEMSGVDFKPRAFDRAADAIAGLPHPLARMLAEGGPKAFDAIPGIGRGIAQRVAELLETGRISELERMRAATPVDVVALTSVEGIGPKNVRALYEQLGVRTLEDLERAANDGRIRSVTRLGERSEQRIRRAIALTHGAGRHLLGAVLGPARAIVARLRALPEVEQADVAGSVRRCRETIGDLDFLAASNRPDDVLLAFTSMPEVVDVLAADSTKALVRLAAGFDADLRVVPPRSWGAALVYFTGNEDHNVALRAMAKAKDLELNEYGLFRDDTFVAGRIEEEVYEALGMQFVPPELREDRGEIDAARKRALPELLQHGALRGDLQVQTRWTDGAASIEQMVAAARARGLEYIAITDHTRDLAMMRGLDEERLGKQRDEIRAMNATLSGFRVLAGAEVNVRKDGTLDLAEEVLATLDIVGVGVHSYFDLSREENTRRVIRAVENPHVDILFHPTCRKIGKRPPIEIDLLAVFAAARRAGTAIEIDAQPDRLDLSDELVREALRAGVSLVVDSDAHAPDELRYPEDFGVGLARRGWATRADVLNTRTADDLLASLKGGKK